LGFASSEGQSAAKLVARHFAWQWVGLDPDADQMRQAVANWIYDTVQRIDMASSGAGGNTLVRILRAHVTDPTTQTFISVDQTRDDLAAERLVRTLLSFLPSYLRSLDALLKWLPQQNPRRQKPESAASAPKNPTQTGDQAQKAQVILASMLPTFGVSSRWPSLKRLGQDLDKALRALRKSTCAGSLSDLAVWLAQVPLMASASEIVALAVLNAFQQLDSANLGIVKSNIRVGNLVHDHLAAIVGANFVLTHPDRYIVADNQGYRPPNPAPVSIDSIWAEREMQKDYSVRVLLQSRAGKLKLMKRAVSTGTSREDLVVFTNDSVPTVSSNGLFDGRPEVYEIKALDSIVSAVPQVTAYSWNYLVASIYIQCTLLPDRPFARVVNTVMIPASPDNHTISIPVISVTEFKNITLAKSPVQTAEEIAQLVQSIVRDSVDLGPYVAVPFMVSGLYGVVPYFVIDVNQAKKVADAVVTFVVEALIAALLAYLAAKKLLKDLWDSIPDAIKAFAGAVIVLALGIAVILALPEEVIVVAVAAVLMAFFSGQGSNQQTPDTSPTQIPNGTIYLGPLAAQCTPAQFAAWMSTALNWYRTAWSAQTTQDTVTVAPPM
jgi:hypothetical protein